MRHLTDGFTGLLGRGRVLICDRDRKSSRAVREFREQEQRPDHSDAVLRAELQCVC